MKLYTLSSKAYESKEHGKALAVQSSRTNRVICLFQHWFTPEILEIFRRVELLQQEKPRHYYVKVAYTMRELKLLWKHYQRQQSIRGIRIDRYQ